MAVVVRYLLSLCTVDTCRLDSNGVALVWGRSQVAGSIAIRVL